MPANAKVLKVVLLTGEEQDDFLEENLVTLKVSSLNGDYLLLEGFEKLEQAVSLCLSQLDQQSVYQINFKVEFVELTRLL